MKSYFKYLILAGLMTGAAMLWWSNFQPGAPGGSAIIDAGPDPEVESPLLERESGVPESVMASEDGVEPAIRNMPGKMSGDGVEQSLDEILEDYAGPGMEAPLAERVLAVLQSHRLAGAFPTMMAMHTCRQTPSPDQVERMRESGRLRPRGAMTTVEQLEREEGDRFLERVWADCEALALAKEDHLETELLNRAGRGDPFARFFYSMWPPDRRFELERSAELALGFETKAIELTLDNVLEGHPLGFLGLGWSYVNGDYFTPRNHPLGIAYLVAAQLCSSGAFPVDEMIENYSSWARIPGMDYPAVEKVAELGVRLNDSYCATSIARTQGPQR